MLKIPYAGVPERSNGTGLGPVGLVPTQVQILSPALIPYLQILTKGLNNSKGGLFIMAEKTTPRNYDKLIEKATSHSRYIHNILVDAQTGHGKATVAAQNYDESIKRLTLLDQQIRELVGYIGSAETLGDDVKEGYKKLEKLESKAEQIIEKLGYKERGVLGKFQKRRAKRHAKSLEETTDEATRFVDQIAAAILALAGVFFVLAPESPTVTGLAVLNLTNPVNTSLSMAFGIVLITTSLILLLRKK